MSRIPLLVPRMPATDALIPYLRQIDSNQKYTNFGPLSVAFEARLLDDNAPTLGAEHVTTVANCTVVAMLFIAELLDLGLGKAVAISFVLSMVLLIGGLVWFLFEVRLSVHAIRVRAELLERERT